MAYRLCLQGERNLQFIEDLLLDGGELASIAAGGASPRRTVLRVRVHFLREIYARTRQRSTGTRRAFPGTAAPALDLDLGCIAATVAAAVAPPRPAK